LFSSRAQSGPLIHADQGIEKKPTLQKARLIDDGKFSGRNPPLFCISAV
jgi:hypothetical protein